MRDLLDRACDHFKTFLHLVYAVSLVILLYAFLAIKNMIHAVNKAEEYE